MKTIRRAVLVGVLLGSLVAEAEAEVIARDLFDGYTEGPLSSESHGEGWKARWLLREGVLAEIEKAKGPGGKQRSSLKVSGANSVSAIARRIENLEANSGKPIYLKVVFEIGASGEDKPVFGAWAFGDALGYRDTLAMATTTLHGSPGVRFGTVSQKTDLRLDAGRPYVLVAELGGWDWEAKQYGAVALWLDPEPEKPKQSQPPHASATGGAGSGAVEMIYFRTHELGSGYYRFFEVTLATTWEEALK